MAWPPADPEVGCGESLCARFLALGDALQPVVDGAAIAARVWRVRGTFCWLTQRKQPFALSVVVAQLAKFRLKCVLGAYFKSSENVLRIQIVHPV
jgi:hypothetical protein